jgi:hypothetical protein
MSWLWAGLCWRSALGKRHGFAPCWLVDFMQLLEGAGGISKNPAIPSHLPDSVNQRKAA